MSTVIDRPAPTEFEAPEYRSVEWPVLQYGHGVERAVDGRRSRVRARSIDGLAVRVGAAIARWGAERTARRRELPPIDRYSRADPYALIVASRTGVR